MAAPGSWPSIRDHGLLSTSALLTRYQIAGNDRTAIEATRRPECITIRKTGLPDAVIRDQKPMTDNALQKCLQDGLQPSDWYRLLNERTFFWLSKERLRSLLAAKAYRSKPQTILTLDTKRLVDSHASRIELSPINSGATLYVPAPRGRGTFQSIRDYDYDTRRRTRLPRNALVELVVRNGVPDIRDHVIAVHDYLDGNTTEIWRLPGADPSIGP